MNTLSTILHYNGTRWDSIHTGSTYFFIGVWGSSADDIYAVGFGGSILHFDGSAWSTMFSGAANDLYGIGGTSGNDVFSVGASGTILHYSPAIPVNRPGGTPRR